jgi:hypothetical protein
MTEQSKTPSDSEEYCPFCYGFGWIRIGNPGLRCECKSKGLTIEELKAEYKEMRKQADKDLRDFKSGRHLKPIRFKRLRNFFGRLFK